MEKPNAVEELLDLKLQDPVQGNEYSDVTSSEGLLPATDEDKTENKSSVRNIKVSGRNTGDGDSNSVVWATDQTQSQEIPTSDQPSNGKVSGGAMQIAEKRIDNCHGAVIADTIYQNFHTAKHVHVPPTLQNAVEQTKRSINYLDTSTHVETRATRKAEKIAINHGKVMITGKSKQGKTTMALYLAKKYRESVSDAFTPVELISPDTWMNLRPDQKYVVIIDDLLGKNVANIDYQWGKVLKQILNKVESGEIILIMTCAQDMYTQCTVSSLGPNVFDKLIHVSLSSDELRLRNFEKVHILEKLCLKFRVKKCREELIQICAESLDDEFLESCEYFIQNYQAKRWNVDFVRHPHQMILEQMVELLGRNRSQFEAMIKAALDSENTTDTASASSTFVKDLVKTNRGLKGHVDNPCPEFLVAVNGQLRFKHKSFRTCAFLAITYIDPPSMIQLCPTDILVRHTTINKAGDIPIDNGLYEELSSRLASNLEDLELVLQHDCFSEKTFLVISSRLIDNLRSKNPVTVLRMAIKYGHTALVEVFLKGTSLESVAPETKHELLHEAFAAANATVCLQFVAIGEEVCDLCLFHLCCSEMNTTLLQDPLDLFAFENVEAVSLDVLLNSLKELLCRGHRLTFQKIKDAIQKRWDYPVLRESVLFNACKFGQDEIYSQTKETDNTFPSPDSLLSYASEGGCMSIVQDLLNMGANTNTRSHPDYMPLHLACKGNHTEVAKILLEAGADITSLSSFNENVLHVNCKYNRESKVDTLHWLLQKCRDKMNLESKDNEGWTPLHVAASVGNVVSLRLLTKAGAHVSPHDIKGNTPVHSHIMGENLNPDVIKHLHEEGADLDARNGSGETPLQMLLKIYGADRCRILQYIISKTKELNSPETSRCSDLFTLISHGCTAEEAEVLIDEGAHVNATNETGNTVLHLVASSGDHILLRLLLSKGALVHARDMQRQTPLHRAVLVPNNLNIVKQLLDARIRDEWHDLQDVSGNTPLHVACENSMEESDLYVKLLIQNHPITDLPNSEHQTPLHLASASNGVTAAKIAETLIRETKADVGLMTESLDRNRNTPLHAACLSSNQHACKIVKLLIQNGANIHTTNANKNTPLHMACQSEGPNKTDIINTLVDFGANLNAQNRDHCTPTDIVVGRGELDIANTLTNALITRACIFGKQRGHDILALWKSHLSEDEKGPTILHKVCEISGKYSKVLINDLVSCQCNVNARDGKGRIPLHTACASVGPYRKDIVKELLKLGSDINCKDYAGHNALHFACRVKTEETAEIVEVLAKSNVSVDERDEDGDTPLHKACKMPGDIYKIIQTLISYGASIDYYNNHGLTPSDVISQSKGHSRTSVVLFSTKLSQICNGNTELKEQGIQFLMQKGAYLDYNHGKGNTVLHKICSEKGKYALKNAKLLLSLGADPHALNAAEETPYDTAVRFNNLGVAELVAEKQKTTEVKMSKMEKFKAGMEGSVEFCGLLHKVYDVSHKAIQKAAKGIEKDNADVADVLNFTADQMSRAGGIVGGLMSIAESITPKNKK